MKLQDMDFQKPADCVYYVIETQCIASGQVVTVSYGCLRFKAPNDRIRNIVHIHWLLERFATAENRDKMPSMNEFYETAHIPVTSSTVDHRGTQDSVVKAAVLD